VEPRRIDIGTRKRREYINDVRVFGIGEIHHGTCASLSRFRPGGREKQNWLITEGRKSATTRTELSNVPLIRGQYLLSIHRRLPFCS
jgi:hypothetical protein